jgi:hypothetical protein
MFLPDTLEVRAETRQFFVWFRLILVCVDKL